MSLSKEKSVSLKKYADNLKDRLKNPVPHKKRGNPITYVQFLKNELKTVNDKLDADKLDGTNK